MAYDFKRVDYGGKYPTFEKYENLTFGELSIYICKLTLEGCSDNDISIHLSCRWSYLFDGLTHWDWCKMVSEYRELQKDIIDKNAEICEQIGFF